VKEGKIMGNFSFNFNKPNFNKIKLLPGTLVYTGNKEKNTEIKHIKYSQSHFTLHTDVMALDNDVVDWIIVEGLSDVEKVVKLCSDYKVDYLVIEDILNVTQRTKVEINDNYIFSVMKYPYIQEHKVQHDYISTLLFEDVIITFSELKNPFIDDVIERIKNKNSQIRQMKHDYLYYVILDMITDETINVFSYIDHTVDDIEQDLLGLNNKDQVKLFGLRKELIFIRSLVKEMLNSPTKKQLFSTRFFDPNNNKYYDDVIDHLLNLQNRTVNQLENIQHIIDVYTNNTANRMNQIMTTLTIFSAIFIPLSFFAGVFGMNFVNFPILQNPYGLLYFTILCILIPSIMFLYFYLKKWFK
jgi:magnesium transporter